MISDRKSVLKIRCSALAAILMYNTEMGTSAVLFLHNSKHNDPWYQVPGYLCSVYITGKHFEAVTGWLYMRTARQPRPKEKSLDPTTALPVQKIIVRAI